jgi:hypothetical protein
VKVAHPRNVAGEVVALSSTFKQPEESIEAPAEGFAERASIVSTRPRTNRGPIIMQSRRGLALSFLLAGSAVVATTRLRQKSACLKTTLKLPKGRTVVGLLVGLETLASPRVRPSTQHGPLAFWSIDLATLPSIVPQEHSTLCVLPE